jgi:hypothetical protein
MRSSRYSDDLSARIGALDIGRKGFDDESAPLAFPTPAGKGRDHATESARSDENEEDEEYAYEEDVAEEEEGSQSADSGAAVSDTDDEEDISPFSGSDYSEDESPNVCDICRKSHHDTRSWSEGGGYPVHACSRCTYRAISAYCGRQAK